MTNDRASGPCGPYQWTVGRGRSPVPLRPCQCPHAPGHFAGSRLRQVQRAPDRRAMGAIRAQSPKQRSNLDLRILSDVPTVRARHCTSTKASSSSHCAPAIRVTEASLAIIGPMAAVLPNQAYCSMCARASYPSAEAICAGVFPSSSFAFTSAPASTRIWLTVELPSKAA